MVLLGKALAKFSAFLALGAFDPEQLEMQNLP
jgi:hypothetical protein